MKKERKKTSFDPNGVGLNNGHFIGLPFEEKEAKIVLLSVPWVVSALTSSIRFCMKRRFHYRQQYPPLP